MSDNGNQAPKEPPSVYQHLMVMVDQMAQVSWAKLGLQPDIITGKLETNLTEAKVAIDVTAFLTQLLEPQMDEADKKSLQGLVRDLRINFVQKNTEVGG